MKIATILALMALSSCANVRMMQACREIARPEPYAAGNAFGLIGASITASQPEHREWQQRVDDCRSSYNG